MTTPKPITAKTESTRVERPTILPKQINPKDIKIAFTKRTQKPIEGGAFDGLYTPNPQPIPKKDEKQVKLTRISHTPIDYMN